MAVLSIIAFGSSSVIVACFRLIPLFELNTSLDVSWVLGKMVIVAALEIQLAVIAVNLPSLKALWIRYTGGSSAGTGPGKDGSKGYRLSSIQKGGSSGYGKSSKVRRGSVTRLERGITSTESEEELFHQAGMPARVTGKEIKVTTDLDVSNTAQ